MKDNIIYEIILVATKAVSVCIATLVALICIPLIMLWNMVTGVFSKYSIKEIIQNTFDDYDDVMEMFKDAFGKLIHL